MYKTAIIGAGFIGNAHIEAVRRLGDVEIVALCDGQGVEEKARAAHIQKTYTDYRVMMDEEDLDVVHVCTPNFTHYEICKAAIEHGISFICEKPFTTTAEQAEELVSLAREKGVKGMVNFHNRFYPVVNEMHQMVKEGEVGKIFSVHGEYIQDWLLYQTDYSWRLVGSQVGKTRAIADIGSHWMDAVEFVTGLKIVKVMAQFSTVYPKRLKPLTKVETFSTAAEDAQYEEIAIDTEDQACVLVEFENGAIGTLIVSQVFSGKKNTTEIKIAGEKESLVWSSESLNDLYIGHRERANELLTKDSGLMHQGTARVISYPSGHIEGFPDAFKQGFRQFYNSLSADGTYDYATLKDGLRETVLCDAVFESAQRKEWVNVPGE